MAGCCEHDKELFLSSIKCTEFLGKLRELLVSEEGPFFVGLVILFCEYLRVFVNIVV